MKIKFSKYHGTGNDFILFDDRDEKVIFENKTIARLCDRHFGIGADGLILLSNDSSSDFRMTYFNADGNEGTMCGNGGRCATAYAYTLGMIETKTEFLAIDGKHYAEILSVEGDELIVSLKMSDVPGIEKWDDGYFINTGSPHFVKFVNSMESIDVALEGRTLRWDKRFQPDGVNVNFVEIHENFLDVRSYERGVENITLSCGTGVTASAITASEFLNSKRDQYEIITYGGKLKVRFKKIDEKYTDIWLQGNAVKVFDGQIEI